MKLNKYKIQQHKISFVFFCAAFLVGLFFMTQLTDVLTRTVEIQAVVVKTYEVPHIGRIGHRGVVGHSGGPHMNIEWIDAEGEVQTEGSIFNEDGMAVGDTFTISVDARTRSRRIVSREGSLFISGLGLAICAFTLWIIRLLFGRDV